MISPPVLFLLDGRGYMLACGIILVGWIVLLLVRWRIGRAIGLGVVLTGGVIWLASGPPLSLIVVVAFPVVLAASAIAEALRTRRADGPRWMRRGIMAALVIFLAGVEASHVPRPQLARGRADRVVVIGDSVSAGIGGVQERTWPMLIRERFGVTVTNLAVAGATIDSAIEQQLPRVPEDATHVIVEIGGNDALYGDRYKKEFANNLERLLASLRRPGRSVVMIELPSLPFCGDHVRSQRRLADRYDVALIPRRCFVAVLNDPGHTLDGVHLTPSGHDAMARMIAEACKPWLAAD